jgi:FkbM family methyltransferase
MTDPGTDVFIDPRFDDEYRRQPLVLVDVGARGGLKRNWKAARRHLRVIGFEPDSPEFGRLAGAAKPGEGSDIYFGVALHNRRGPIALHVARDRGLTSIFEPNRAFVDAFPDAARFDTIEVAEVQADTLDNLLDGQAIRDVDFIKADTQGSELFVLQGAAHALDASIVGVEVETEFAPIYTNQPLFADVDAFLRGLGFALFDLRPVYWKRAAGWNVGGPWGQIVWGDALYLKTIPALRATIASAPAESRRNKTLRAISVALLYGYRDYALEIVSACGEALAAGDREVIERRIRAGGPRDPLPKFPGRRVLAGTVHRLWKAFRDRGYGWSVSGSKLGNPE